MSRRYEIRDDGITMQICRGLYSYSVRYNAQHDELHLAGVIRQVQADLAEVSAERDLLAREISEADDLARHFVRDRPTLRARGAIVLQADEIGKLPYATIRAALELLGAGSMPVQRKRAIEAALTALAELERAASEPSGYVFEYWCDGWCGDGYRSYKPDESSEVRNIEPRYTAPPIPKGMRSGIGGCATRVGLTLTPHGACSRAGTGTDGMS